MAKLVKISPLPNESDRKFLSDAQLQPNPALIAEGWQRRFTADAQRVKEVLELYTLLGYEVRTEPITTRDLDDDCHECQTSATPSLCTVYTRKR